MCIISLEDTPEFKRLPNLTTGPNALLFAIFLCVSRGLPAPDPLAAPRGTVNAYINHGRWVVDCPYCANALIASKLDARFWCTQCGMERNEGAPLRVIFPRRLEDIESLLCLRPNLINRNWYPDESVDDLRRENIEHEIGK